MIIRSNEFGGSYYMEKEGLSRSVKYLSEQNLTIGTLITDRHRSVAKWVGDVLPQTSHRYDIWHVAKVTYDSYVIYTHTSTSFL